MDCRISNRLIDVTKERMKCLSQEEINIQEKTLQMFVLHTYKNQ